MNFKYWVGACALSLVGLSASAQSHVTLFGVVDMAMNASRSGGVSTHRMVDGGDAASRIGVRGSEDLGGGLRLNFMLEGGVNAPTGTGTVPGPAFAFTRQSFMTFSSPWGSFDMGRMYTPVFMALYRADPLGMNALNSSLNLIYSADAQPGLRPFAPRANGMLRYRSPAGKPLFLDAGYSHGNSLSPGGKDGRLYSVSVGWNRKPWYLAYSIQTGRTATEASGVISSYRSKHQALSAGWHASDAVRFTGNYIHAKASRTGVNRSRIAHLAGEWQVTPTSKVMASIASRKVSSSDRSQTTWTLGYNHMLSKRTVLYGRWLQLRNSGGSSVSMGGVPVLADSGHGIRSLALGIRHNF